MHAPGRLRRDGLGDCRRGSCCRAAPLALLRLLHNGAFWRDECSSIILSQAPTWREMWSHLVTDSFPGLFVSLLRLWRQSGLGASDFGIGLLGVLISLGLLVSVYLSCRAMRARFPALALCLVGLNSVIFYMGSSIRAYGLAALLIVACFAAFWRVAVRPTRWNMGLALSAGRFERALQLPEFLPALRNRSGRGGGRRPGKALAARRADIGDVLCRRLEHVGLRTGDRPLSRRDYRLELPAKRATHCRHALQGTGGEWPIAHARMARGDIPLALRAREALLSLAHGERCPAANRRPRLPGVGAGRR